MKRKKKEPKYEHNYPMPHFYLWQDWERKKLDEAENKEEGEK